MIWRKKNRPHTVDDSNNMVMQNRPQAVEDFNKNILFSIPWGHHRFIIDKCKGNVKKSIFFVRKTLENNWSRNVLLNWLDTDLYEREGKAVSNFKNTLPAPQSDLAQQITKDPYSFDFLALRENYDERDLEDALDDEIRSVNTARFSTSTV
ncbi:MAG TPA: hypothetical protein DIS88_00875 [Prevotella sp.]|nr:hypothetical protein [Prevotella sp.]